MDWPRLGVYFLLAVGLYLFWMLVILGALKVV